MRSAWILALLIVLVSWHTATAQQHLQRPFSELLRRAADATTSTSHHLVRRSPQDAQSAADGCRKCDNAVLPCPQCGEDQVCTLVKRTCQECARNVCTHISVIASASNTSNSKANDSVSKSTPWVISGICAGAVVVVALGLFAVWKRQQSKKIVLGESTADKEDEEDEDGFVGKSSMELEHGDQFLFPPPAVAWRSSQTSSMSWDEDNTAKNRTVAGLRLEADVARKQSFERANAATNTLASMAMVSSPDKAIIRSASPLLPEPAVPAGDRVLLPEFDGLSRFSMNSASFDFTQFGSDNASNSGQKSPSFPCPGVPPPRPPVTAANNGWRDSSVNLPGLNSSRSSVSNQSIHSVAQINVARVKPMTARETMIRRSLLGDKVVQPMVGSLAEVQGWQRASNIRDSQRMSYAPRLSLGRHASTASLGNAADLQRLIHGEPTTPAKLKRNSSLTSHRTSAYGL